MSKLAATVRLEMGRNATEESAAGPAEIMEEDLLRRIFALVRVRLGHDFSKYKRSTVLRRISRRMRVTRTSDLAEYHEYLREHPEELRSLLADLLISVTTFFRDPAAFEALKSKVLPNLFETKQDTDAIRVWVPGCATGEEAYSIAMLLLEEAPKHQIRPPIQVFASDLDASAVAKAREGRYPSSIESNVSPERLRRFFVQEGDGYRVRAEMRDIVLFANHDLLKDPPFSRLDLVSCRNLLIYLDRDLQEQVCTTFHYALNDGGFLLLGTSEAAEKPPGLFRSVDRAARIYQSLPHAADRPRLLARLPGEGAATEPVIRHRSPLSPGLALQEAALHRRAIEEVAPPSILVDENHSVIHMSEHAGRFAAPAGGPLTSDVVDLVRPELRIELRSALHRAFDQNRATLSLPVLVRFNGAPHPVHMQVKPTAAPGDTPRHALVMFMEGDAVEESSAPAGQRQATDDTVRRLTEELELTQASMRAMREESEASNEELRAANEELQSMNEEYRSTSEELETSKEELQSINEELQTVNNELKLKLDAVSEAHGDLQNLMAATEFGILFLNSDLKIKRFTEQVTQLFSIKSGDEGRPITDFAHQLEFETLTEDARSVLENLVPIRHEIQGRGGEWYEVRIRPYRTLDEKIDGVIITFVDMTERRKIEEALRRSETALKQKQRLVDMSRDAIFVWDFESGIMDWNRGCEDLYGYGRSEAIGKAENALLATRVPGSSFEELVRTLRECGSWAGELEHKTKDGSVLTVEARIQLESFDGHQLVLESTRATGRPDRV